ncbi:primosomal protein N' [Flavihumibacter rivuli]|uniref:replication restart helicase PriA n=1 Tax=Flavihumibacter rivuli TaxID=2838156 RepID=UPI001BDF2784|nr:primosomal protein N' [Flavihumibacter rivuli]ULQ57446.1 primosomal protein N' [Flavihumibacter rivuli]
MEQKENTLYSYDENGSTGWYAEVLIPLALPRNFTWAVPADLLELVMPGVRVEVILGKNKKYAGIVKSVHQNKPAAFTPKDILNVLDDQPILYPNQLGLWEWMARYYLCSEGEVMQAALPTHFKLSSETILLFNDEAGDDFSHLDDEEFLVAEALTIRKELKLVEVQQLLDATHVYPVIKRLLDKGICLVWEELKETYKEKKESFVLLHPQYDNEEQLAELLNNWGRAPKQMELLLAFLHLRKTQGQVTQAELLKKADASAAQLKGLVEKGVIQVEKRSVDRIRQLPLQMDIDFVLTIQQEEALEKVRQVFEDKQVCLLHGVTSSGKTQVYIKLMEDLVKQGKQVLYMLPEIALTAQIIRRLQKHFGGYIAIYHSKFNPNERVEIWNKVKSGEVKIIVGARSALFLPFRDLSLVICDEEHDPSFKQQDPAPRYNGRDAAIYLASLYKGRVLLGSATPSLESYYNALQGKYGLVEMTQRYGDLAMPHIELVDTRNIKMPDNSKVIISAPLQEAIESCLVRNKQVILFQNRRGYSPYQVCQVCGWIPHCKHCDVSLTFHKLHNKLVCHYCGTVYPPLHTCEACGNHLFAQQNFGTERIEETLQELFPKARIARMDIDSVKGKNAHDALIQLFEQQRLDILVGTQMVVKGLDFEHVALVGILDADAILGFADFRVNERGFQLMEQVSGRAGRKGEQGRVMIQLKQTNHPVLQFVRQHDYASFAQVELTNRQHFGYPPFTRLIVLQFKHKQQDTVIAAARQMAQWLHPQFGEYLVGPAAPVVNRVRNQYIMELLVKLPKESGLTTHCKEQIHILIAHLHQQPGFKSVVVTPDIDPL